MLILLLLVVLAESWSEQTKKKSISGDKNSIVVTSLAPATAYDFRLFARNQLGMSDGSEVLQVGENRESRESRFAPMKCGKCKLGVNYSLGGVLSSRSTAIVVLLTFSARRKWNNLRMLLIYTLICQVPTNGAASRFMLLLLGGEGWRKGESWNVKFEFHISSELF